MTESIHPLAGELNQSLDASAPAVLAMLSPLGRRLYFPKGILSQSAEAKAKGKRFNATIGIATEGNGPMYLPSIQAQLSGVTPAEAYPYAPPAGRPTLRAAWRKKLLAENPSLSGKRFGEPIVTSAITHGLSLAGDLFVGPGDLLLMPDQLWGNYRLTYEVRMGAQIATFPFFDGKGMNVTAFAEALKREAAGRDKLIVVLNFPNNPTGYMPTEAEGDAIVAALEGQARAGTRLVVLCDDAYFGLFYHLDGPSMTESMFGRLTGRHPNLMAVKLDGATKELFVWGFRCGFVTFGPGDPQTADTVVAVLDAKARGAIRSAISNSPQLSQALVEHALASDEIAAERADKCRVLEARAKAVHRVAHASRYRESWDVYPFNSGYFMLIRVKGVDAHKLRTHLLDAHETGLISTSGSDLRVAFSCLEEHEVEPLFETIHQAIGELK
ncbi:MAG: aminotransferase class I/II-fold pyridoxal phosphate-dependent enzyme [Myxococcales bacterium]|nr:aminotransferase class I/II-fold pyridoxal phosphate-dependent enzyme [Myxococcales bacterium]